MADETESSRQKTFPVSPALAAFAIANPGFQINAAAAGSISAGTTTWHTGCIKDLWYETEGQKLHAVRIDGTYYYSEPTISGVLVKNLDAFREPFERAASFGMQVSFGVLADDNMYMLHTKPCLCPCDQ